MNICSTPLLTISTFESKAFLVSPCPDPSWQTLEWRVPFRKSCSTTGTGMPLERLGLFLCLHTNLVPLEPLGLAAITCNVSQMPLCPLKTLDAAEFG